MTSIGHLTFDRVRDLLRDQKSSDDNFASNASIIALGSLVSIVAGTVLTTVTSDRDEVEWSFESFKKELRKSGTFVITALVMMGVAHVSFDVAEKLVSWVLLQKFGRKTKLWNSMRKVKKENPKKDVLSSTLGLDQALMTLKLKTILKEFMKDPKKFLEDESHQLQGLKKKLKLD